ncbi:hypothetical protein PRZ48_013028 [Zasmidium cellare]|uniref:Apple domain-containing protein n=1 Tax=Zasmidium cellare TaxID=395010 RepID=A0ABR0E396_ZASCE|nr:hypothetical protein PRZ48_013028 [Zasmidium cellare]
MQCDKTYAGTVITGGSRKRQAEYTIENCLTACNGVTDCVAVSVLNGACFLLSDVNGYSTQSGAAAALNEVRAEAAGISENAIPSLDPPASSSSPLSTAASTTSTPSAGDATATVSNSPAAQDSTTSTANDSTTSTSSDANPSNTQTTSASVTESSTAPSVGGGNDDSSDSTTSSTASASITSAPSAGASDDQSADTTSSSASGGIESGTATVSESPSSTSSSSPSSGDDTSPETQSSTTASPSPTASEDPIPSSPSNDDGTSTASQATETASSTASESSTATMSEPADSTVSSSPSDDNDSSTGNTLSSPASTTTSTASDAGTATVSESSQSTESSSPSTDDGSSTGTQSATASTTSTISTSSASSTPGSDNALGCSAPTAGVIGGLPAAACGTIFDKSLNDVLGYYSDNVANLANVEAAIIPRLAATGTQKRALTDTIQTLAKDAIRSILLAAEAAVNAIGAALPGDVQSAQAAVADVSNSVAYGAATQTLALKRSPDSVHKVGTQWSFPRRAVHVPAQGLYATGLNTGSPAASGTISLSSSAVLTSLSSALGTAPTLTPSSNQTSAFPTAGTATSGPAANQTVPLSTGAVLPSTSSKLTASTGFVTISPPTNATFGLPPSTSSETISVPLDTALVSSSTFSGNRTIVLSTGAPPTLSTSSPTLAANQTIPSPNATAPAADKVNSALITIRDTTGALQLQPGSDGSLFVSKNDADVSSLSSSSFAWDQTSDVVFGDSSSRLLHYFPSELSSLGASRFRLAGWGDIPIGASLLNLVPFQTDAVSDPVLVAVDSLGNYLWPFVCGLQGQTNKVFLVNDLDNGASILEGSDLVYTIVGGVAQNCAPLALTGNGMTGINA